MYINIREFTSTSTMINVDETGFNLSMRESQGRSKIGVRAQTRVPAIRSRNINVMAATHNRAMTHYQILEGNSNAESFPHFIDDLAAQRDRNHLPANSIIILDNVGFHRSPIVVEMLELRGFEYRYLPPYSPFFMGIECLFSQWKKHVKEGLHGHRALNENDLMNRINDFQLDEEKALAYFAHIRNNCMAYLAGVRVFDN